MDNIIDNITIELSKISNTTQLEEIRVKYFGKNGQISKLANDIKNQPKEHKASYGKKINEIKNKALVVFEAKAKEINDAELIASMSKTKIDITQPGYQDNFGTMHPLTQITNKVVDILAPLGYSVAIGDEIVSDLNNFEKLNLTKDHPARDMQDTFYFDAETLLRTHTSSVQIKTMENQKTMPIKILCPGKVYRRDDDDATHSHQFSQIEGLFLDKNVSMADLKATLNHLLKKLFGPKVQTRFRPSYFPFTEPSVEVDISCFACNPNSETCSICKKTNWIEILGAGMVHPDVLKNCGIRPSAISRICFWNWNWKNCYAKVKYQRH